MQLPKGWTTLPLRLTRPLPLRSNRTPTFSLRSNAATNSSFPVATLEAFAERVDHAASPSHPPAAAPLHSNPHLFAPLKRGYKLLLPRSRA